MRAASRGSATRPNTAQTAISSAPRGSSTRVSKIHLPRPRVPPTRPLPKAYDTPDASALAQDLRKVGFARATYRYQPIPARSHKTPGRGKQRSRALARPSARALGVTTGRRPRSGGPGPGHADQPLRRRPPHTDPAQSQTAPAQAGAVTTGRAAGWTSEGDKRVYYRFALWLGLGSLLGCGGPRLWAGPCEQPGFGLVEETEADQALKLRSVAFDVLGHHGQIQREAQVAGA